MKPEIKAINGEIENEKLCNEIENAPKNLIRKKILRKNANNVKSPIVILDKIDVNNNHYLYKKNNTQAVIYLNKNHNINSGATIVKPIDYSDSPKVNIVKTTPKATDCANSMKKKPARTKKTDTLDRSNDNYDGRKRSLRRFNKPIIKDLALSAESINIDNNVDHRNNTRVFDKTNNIYNIKKKKTAMIDTTKANTFEMKSTTSLNEKQCVAELSVPTRNHPKIIIYENKFKRNEDKENRFTVNTKIENTYR